MTIVTEHQDVNPVVAEVVRSGFTESRHRGAVAGLATVPVIGGEAVVGVIRAVSF